MRVNKCPECDAKNTLQSRICWNCGANITAFGKVKSFIKGLIQIAIFFGVLYLLNLMEII